MKRNCTGCWSPIEPGEEWMVRHLHFQHHIQLCAECAESRTRRSLRLWELQGCSDEDLITALKTWSGEVALLEGQQQRRPA